MTNELTMSRRETIHELAQVLAICCADDTIAKILDATVSADSDERLSDWQAQQAEALFDSLSVFRPDCVELAHKRKPTPGFWQWINTLGDLRRTRRIEG